MAPRRKTQYASCMSLNSTIVAIISVLICPALLSAGTISGKVTYAGKPPASKTIDMSSEPDCAKEYSTPPATETIVTGANNVLQNVVVFVSAGANDDKTQTQPVILAQKGCRYTPHEQGCVESAQDPH